MVDFFGIFKFDDSEQNLSILIFIKKFLRFREQRKRITESNSLESFEFFAKQNILVREIQFEDQKSEK